MSNNIYQVSGTKSKERGEVSVNIREIPPWVVQGGEHSVLIHTVGPINRSAVGWEQSTLNWWCLERNCCQLRELNQTQQFSNRVPWRRFRGFPGKGWRSGRSLQPSPLSFFLEKRSDFFFFLFQREILSEEIICVF